MINYIKSFTTQQLNVSNKRCALEMFLGLCPLTSPIPPFPHPPTIQLNHDPLIQHITLQLQKKVCDEEVKKEVEKKILIKKNKRNQKQNEKKKRK